MQKARGGRGGGAEGPSPGRRMSLADMREAGFEMQGMSKLRADLSEVEVQEYRDFYEIVDEDGNGVINRAEMEKVLKTMGNSPSPEELDRSWTELDADSDGDVNKEEFIKWLTTSVLQ